MLEVLRGREDRFHFFLAQHSGKPLGLLGARNPRRVPLPLERALEEKLQRTITLTDHGLRSLSLFDQIIQILPNLIIAQVLKRFADVGCHGLMHPR